MDIGVVFQLDPPAREVVDLAVAAEEAGFTHVWSFDSHILWEEPYVIYSQILARTSRVVVGPMVTNPAGRDVTVTASTFATLNDLYGNRTICGIGRGDSALRTLGKPPVDLAELRESVEVIRALANGRSCEYRGVSLTLPWVKSSSSLEVWVAAYGPKALALAGEVADGFILQLADVDIAEWMIRSVRDAAAAAGRDPSAVKFCVAAPAYVGTDLAHMRDQTRWFGGMVGNHEADIVRRYGETGAVPLALTEYIRGRTGYDYAAHGRAGNPHASFVPDEIVDRFCVLGPPEAHVERLAKLRQLGVDQFAVYLQHDDKAGTLAAYRDEVIPAMRYL
jgi:probable F420-dependent oxidoreductase